uniref:CUB domain-containing protein n=1 Tax=Tetranychus urticae TaxID=32264 RepID=T1KIT1_TETUR
MMIFQSGIKHLWTFFVITLSLNLIHTHGKIIDQVYEQCNRPVASRLPLECIGFPRTTSDCLTRQSCDMVAMVSVVPSTDGNHFDDSFNLTLIGTHLRDASKHEMSFILDAAFMPTYNPGEGTYYNCSWTQGEPTVDVMVKNPGQIVRSIGQGTIEEDLLVCQWVMNRSATTWPTDHEAPTVTNQILNIVLALPIPDSLDFNVYSFDYVTNNSYYDVTLYAADDAPGFQVICGKYSLEAYFISPNGSQELSTSVITSMRTHIDTDFDGLRCNWTLPKLFKVFGVTFDTKTVKYMVKLRHSPNFYVDKAPVALPGFQISESIYKACSTKSKERECFGLNTNDPMGDCFTSRDCQAFAVFTVEDETNWPTFVEPKMILDLYASKSLSYLKSSSMSTASPQAGVNMSLSLSTENDKEAKTVYKCTNDGRRISSIEYPFRPRPVRSGSIFTEADWVRCQWIWWPNGTNWPTNNRSEIIDLVNQRPSIQLAVGTEKKVLPATSVTLPIYKLRYFYQECEKTGENLCLQSEPGCLKSSSCTSLIHMKKHHGDTIDVEVFLTQDFDKLELIYVDPEENSIKIECYNDKSSSDRSAISDESFKVKKSEQFQPIQTQFTKYSESRRFKMGFSRCSWLQEKQLSIGPFTFNSEINRYDIKLLVTSYDGFVARYSWDKVAILL